MYCIAYAIAQVVLAKYQHEADVVRILQSPTAVMVREAVKPGALHLPCTSMKVERKQGKGSVGVGWFPLAPGEEPTMLYAHPAFTPPVDKVGAAASQPWVVPFWLIPHSDEPNMKLKWEAVDLPGQLVAWAPVMTNGAALKAQDMLTWNSHGSTCPKASKKRKAEA